MYGLGITIAPRPTLEQIAAEETAWRECRALEPVLGPCRMRPPSSLTTAHMLEPIEVSAPFPWVAVTVLSVIAFFALGKGQSGVRI